MTEKKRTPKKIESSVEMPPDPLGASEMPIDPLGTSEEPVDPLKKEKIGRREDVVRER